MKVRIHRERPDPWVVRRERIKHGWTTPFWAIEWVFEWVAFALSRWTFLDVLEYLEGFSVLIGVIFYFSESGDRIKQKHYQAWQVINTAQGKGGSGGRIEALQELNHDGIPLVGVDVSGAFLQNVWLEHARLLRSNFSSADLRDANFRFADLSDAELRSANFRGGHLEGADFQRANLEDVDLTEADLSGANLTGANLFDVELDSANLSGAILADADLRNASVSNLRWRELRSVKNANIYGVKNAPEGFVAWAKQHGAVETKSD
jgi:Pentapeptide repeats (8 copies)